jgi:uncharacterized protein with PIN domain
MAEKRAPEANVVVCAECGRGLISLTYLPPVREPAAARAKRRPDLKCPGCGRYQWQDSAG